MNLHTRLREFLRWWLTPPATPEQLLVMLQAGATVDIAQRDLPRLVHTAQAHDVAPCMDVRTAEGRCQVKLLPEEFGHE